MSNTAEEAQGTFLGGLTVGQQVDRLLVALINAGPERCEEVADMWAEAAHATNYPHEAVEAVKVLALIAYHNPRAR